jgi:ethanolamine utilization protein EutN
LTRIGTCHKADCWNCGRLARNAGAQHRRFKDGICRKGRVFPHIKRPEPLENKMILARVLGNIVATKKNQRYESASIMLCQQVTPEGDETATTVLALNTVDAGVGDTVLIVQEGWSASTAATGKPGAAIDSAIVGVVDYVDLLN